MMFLSSLKKQNLLLFSYIILFRCFLTAQETATNQILFQEPTLLQVELTYANKDLKRNTDKSSTVTTQLFYQQDNEWKHIPVSLRARGNFRRDYCYFCPIRIDIAPTTAKNTLFEGQKNLKVVLPCLLNTDANDAVLKEYIAYKIYETFSPYHFKTRLAIINLTETIGRTSKTHVLKAILIEDDDVVATRLKGNIQERMVHPLQQNATCSIRNCLFQYMIGNTDFSSAYSHNQKLLFLNGHTYPMPYDFDMSGFVNASYALVPDSPDLNLPIKKVTDRVYRGFRWDKVVLRQVRHEFIENKPQILALVDSFKDSFDDRKAFWEAKNYLQGFFQILENEQAFKNEIEDKARFK